MSNLANYSPTNKSYKYILFQNQAYHQSNKKQAKPCIRSNIKYKKLSQNPESSKMPIINNMGVQNYQKLTNSLPKNAELNLSNVSLKSVLSKQKRVIHKNQSFEKFRKNKIIKQNSFMVQRLLNSTCQIIKNQTSRQSFRKHLKYRQIRRVFDSKNVPKQQLKILNQKYLSPTLATFRRSLNDFNFARKLSSKDNTPELKMYQSTYSQLSGNLNND